ncbi:HEAT repeat domain-containing protein [Halorarius halobius]|uniref:HEAT repeat domain-containing protein n=1 Tax=Halorarius halobius TaxID=2962671 RepID=UPI0020CDDA9E|nr:HEAT repeat domain-containing protein [Halorarius halobius]
MGGSDAPSDRAETLRTRVTDDDGSLTDDEVDELVGLLGTADPAGEVAEDAVVALWCTGFVVPDAVKRAVPSLVAVADQGTDTGKAYALLLLNGVVPYEEYETDPVVDDLYAERETLLSFLDEYAPELDDEDGVSPRDGLVLAVGTVARVHDDVRDAVRDRLTAADPGVRTAALDVLASVPLEAADPSSDVAADVVAAVDDPDPDVRAAALYALTALDDAETPPDAHVDLVLERTDDDAEIVREAASEVLASFAETDEAVWNDVADDLRRGDAAARRQALAVVRELMGVTGYEGGMADLFEAFSDMYGWDTDVDLDDERMAAVADPLVEAVEADDPELAASAAETLGYVAVGFDDPDGREREIEAAIDALHAAVHDDERTEVRATAASALGFALANVHDPAAFEDTIIAAAETLLVVVNPEADHDEDGPLPATPADPAVRTSAAETLGELVDAYEPLARPLGADVVAALDPDDPDPAFTVALVETIGDVRSQTQGVVTLAFDRLLRLAEHDDPKVAAAALEALDDSEVRSALPFVADTLADQLERDDPDVLDGAASALAETAERSPDAVVPHVEALAGVLTDEALDVDPDSITDKGAPAAAAAALGEVTEAHPEETADAVEELVRSLRSDDPARVHRGVALVPELLEFVDPTVDRDTRERVLEELATIAREGEPESREQAFDTLQSVLSSIETRRRHADDEETPDEPTPGLRAVRDAIEDGLTQRYGDCRWHAARAADEFASVFPNAAVDIAPPVLELLEQRETTTRNETTAALSYVGTVAEESPDPFVDHVPLFDSYLTEDDGTIRSSAASTLASLAENHGEAVEPAARHLRECLDDEYARESALEALAEMALDCPSAVAPVGPVFVEVLREDAPDTDDDGDGFESDRSDDGWLGEMQSGLEALVGDMSRAFLDRHAVKGIAGLSVSEPASVEGAAGPLVDRLENGADGELMTRSGTESLNRIVRLWASFGLATLARHDDERLSHLRGTFIDHVNDEEEFVRTQALRGLAWTADPETDGRFEPRFVELLEDDQAMLRRAGIIGLGHLEARDHLTEIRRLARTDDSDLVTSAAGDIVDYFEGDEDRISVDQEHDDVGVFLPDDADDRYSL